MREVGLPGFVFVVKEGGLKGVVFVVREGGLSRVVLVMREDGFSGVIFVFREGWMKAQEPLFYPERRRFCYEGGWATRIHVC